MHILIRILIILSLPLLVWVTNTKFPTSAFFPTHIFEILSEPQELSIPKLHIKTTIEHVGLDHEKNMDVPKDTNHVGWYTLGPKPGERGNAVIDGHFDSKTGPAVFYKLSDLERGDSVFVTDKKGTTIEFVVTKKAVYPQEAFPLEEIFGKRTTKNLNLITCTGTFNKTTKNYSDRIVVYTKLREP